MWNTFEISKTEKCIVNYIKKLTILDVFHLCQITYSRFSSKQYNFYKNFAKFQNIMKLKLENKICKIMFNPSEHSHGGPPGDPRRHLWRPSQVN